MNFEAVPCVLKNADGAPMYGLLIRPLQQNQQFLINVPSSSSPPSTVVQQQTHQQVAGYVQNHQQQAVNNLATVTTGSLNNIQNNNSRTAAGRRSYPTILPRETNTNTFNNACNKNSNAQSSTYNNPVFIPATTVQNFQQSRGGANVQQSVRTFSAPSIATAPPAQPQNFTLDVAQASSIAHRQQQQLSYNNYNNNMNSGEDINKQQQIIQRSLVNVPSQPQPPASCYSLPQSFNEEHATSSSGNNQQQQGLSTSELENILQGFDSNEINSLLQELYEPHDLVQLDPAVLNGGQLEMLDSGTVGNKPTMAPNYAANSNYGLGDEDVDAQARDNNTRPPCRYQNFLMNGNNLRVNNCSTSAYGGDERSSNATDGVGDYRLSIASAVVSDDLSSYCNYSSQSRDQHPIPLPPQHQNQQQQFVDHHESGTPDSGIQSIGESPHAIAQNSPMQQQLPSHSPLISAQMSPRFFSTASISPYISKFPPSGRRRLMSGGSETAPRMLEPLTVNTGCYELISSDSDDNSPTNEGLLATSTPKQQRSSDDAEFADMPILEPQGKTESKGKSELSKSCEEKQRAVVAIGQEKNGEIVLTNIADPNSLVDKLLSALAPEQLTSFSQLFEAKLKAAGISVDLAALNKNNADLATLSTKNHVIEETTNLTDKSLNSSVDNETCVERWQVNGGYVSDASSASPNVFRINNVETASTSVQAMEASSSTRGRLQERRRKSSCNSNLNSPKTPTSSNVDENKLKKLNEYRLKMKQKLITDTIVREMNSLCELMDKWLLVPPPSSATHQRRRRPSFEIDWQDVSERRRRLNMQASTSKVNKEEECGADKSDKTSFDTLQNLEQEASESGSEDGEVKDEHQATTARNIEEERLVTIVKGVAKEPLKLKLRLFLNKSKKVDKVVKNKKVDKEQKSKKVDIEEAKSPTVDEMMNSGNANTGIVRPDIEEEALPLKKRFKLRLDEKNIEEVTSRKRRNRVNSNSVEENVKKKRCSDMENNKKSPTLADLARDLPLLSVELDPLDVGNQGESFLPTLSPQVSPTTRSSTSKSSNSPKSSNAPKSSNSPRTSTKIRLNPNLLRKCRICCTWIKVANVDDEMRNKKKNAICKKCAKSTSEEVLQCNKRKTLPLSPKSSTLVNDQSNSKVGQCSAVSVMGTKMAAMNVDHFLMPKKKYAKTGLFFEKRNAESQAATPAPLISPTQCRLFNGAVSNVQDFRLPYDIWWEFVYQKNYVCHDPSTNFRRIRNNIYVDFKASQNFHCQTCNCQPPVKENEAGCGDDCLNRMMFTECNANSCNCGDKCSNKRFQRHQWISTLERFDTKTNKGSGVRTTKHIKSDSFICEYVGEIVSTETFAERMRTWYKNCQHHYALNLDSGTVIDGYRCGSMARFINHSCEPNCEIQKWMVNGQYRMGIFSLRDVDVGEELTYNYNFHAFNNQQLCLCSSDKCSGAMGGNKQRETAHQTRKNKPRHVMFRQNSSDPNSICSQLLKPLTPKERVFAKKRRIFLLRNFDKLQRKLKVVAPAASTVDDEKKRADAILAQLTALKTKSRVHTRRLADSEENRQMQTVVALAQILEFILNSLTEAKDEDHQQLCAPFSNLPSRKKTPMYFEKVERPIDVSTIRRNIVSGVYVNPRLFDDDVNLLLKNSKLAFAPNSPQVRAAAKLASLYENLKSDSLEQLRDVLGFVDINESNFVHTSSFDDREKNASGSAVRLVGSYDPDDDSDVWEHRADLSEPEVDKVRCKCGIFEEDGTMIQCDRCLYWLHGDCVGESATSDEFLCDYCVRGCRTSSDVVLVPQPELTLLNCVYYRTLSCGKLQIRIGECVYLKRDVDEKHKRLLLDFNRECVRATKGEEASNDSIDSFRLEEPNSTNVAATSDVGVYERKDLRIMRVERLFIGPRGVRFIFGSYIAHPHETFCEPSRRFYKNEVFVTPLYDTWPLETVVGRCLILDPQTYCRGRPKYPKYDDADVYVCEYRVDKNQRLFDKMSMKNRFQTNTKGYIFSNFAQKMKIARDFTPFAPKSKPKSKPKQRKPRLQNIEEQKSTAASLVRQQKEIRLAKLIDKVVEHGIVEKPVY